MDSGASLDSSFYTEPTPLILLLLLFEKLNELALHIRTHLICHMLIYHPHLTRLLPNFSSFSVLQSISEAMSHAGWGATMEEEMNALRYNGTWELVKLPSDQSVVGCR